MAESTILKVLYLIFYYIDAAKAQSCSRCVIATNSEQLPDIPSDSTSYIDKLFLNQFFVRLVYTILVCAFCGCICGMIYSLDMLRRIEEQKRIEEGRAELRRYNFRLVARMYFKIQANTGCKQRAWLIAYEQRARAREHDTVDDSDHQSV